MTRKLLFVLRHRQPLDDLEYIVRIAQYNKLSREKDEVDIKVLLLNEYYLFDNFPDYSENPLDVKIRPDLLKLLDSGVEVAYDINLDYPEWHDTYDPTEETEYALYVGMAFRFKESGIIRVDPYEYVANGVKFGYEIIKW